MKTSEEQYYQRQIILPEIGIDGQQKIKSGKVLVIGAGGLGCPILEYLTRTGVGKIGIMDGDRIDLTNLHRQSLYTYIDVSKSKVRTAEKRLKSINPFIDITVFESSLNATNAIQIIKEFDVIVDATDNYPTRYLINDVCVLLNKPLVYGAIYRFEGQVSVFNFNKGPTYRCLFPDYPTMSSDTNCSEAGVLGVLPGIIGLMQANETIKLLLGHNDVLSGKLLTYNAKSGRTNIISIERKDLFHYHELMEDGGKLNHPFYYKDCSILPEIEIDVLSWHLQNNTSLLLIDVRDPDEKPSFIHPMVINQPLTSIDQIIKLPEADKIVVFCKSGKRSQIAQEKLMKVFPKREILNLTGGITPEIIELCSQIN